MNIIQCRYCKRPFTSVGSRVCPSCMEQIDRDFITVRDYIYENRQTNIDIVSKETEVSKQIILHLLKEGRLIIDDPSGEGGGLLNCEMCKKPINTGKLCKDCKGKVSTSLDRSSAAGKGAAQQAAAAQKLKGSAKIQGK